MTTWRDIRETNNLRELDDTRCLKSYAIQSQYSASPRLLALMAGFQRQLEITVDVDAFYDNFFNIYSARGEGLDGWGHILAIGRTVTSPTTGAVLTLEDELYRLLLLYKAMANISASDAHSLNSLLASLIDTGIGDFPRAAYVIEVNTMVIRWVFEGFLDDMQWAVFYAAGTLARGAGVGWELYAIDSEQVLGFDGSGMQPFNLAPFAPDNALIQNNGS